MRATLAACLLLAGCAAPPPERTGGGDLPTIEAAMRIQSTREKRLACADLVVFNDTDSIDNLQHLARALANRFGL